MEAGLGTELSLAKQMRHFPANRGLWSGSRSRPHSKHDKVQFWVLGGGERTTFTDAGEILYLMDPGVMLEQLHANECFAANTAGEARLSWWETNN